MIRLLGIFLLLSFLFACSGPGEKEELEDNTGSAPAVPASEDYTVEVVSSDGGTFGYIIHKKDKAFIRQPQIPGTAGNKGFATEEEARRIGELVKKKLLEGSFPPTVSRAELDSLKIQY